MESLEEIPSRPSLGSVVLLFKERMKVTDMNSLKSIMSRYTQIKAKGFNDEDATKLNDVTKALTSIGIQAVDSQGQLRDFTLVLDDLGKKWPELTKNEQAYISTAMAGTYQRNRFITLMSNYSTYTENYAIALDGAGVAQKKFNTYQESSQAHLDRMTAAWQNVGKALFDSNLIKTIIDIGAAIAKVAPLIANFAISLTLVINLFKLFKVEGAGLGALFASMGTGLKGLATGANLAKIAMGALSTVGVMALVAAIGVAVVKISNLIQKNKEWKKSIEGVTEAKKKYLELPDEENAANYNQAAEDRIKLIDEEIKRINETLKKYKGMESSYQGIIDSSKDRIAQLAEEKNGLKSSIKEYKGVENAQDALLEIQEAQKKAYNDLYGTQIPIVKSSRQIAAAEQAEAKAVADAAEAEAAQQKVMDDLTEAFDKNISSMGDMAQLYDEINEGGKISAQTLVELLQKYPEYNQQIMFAIGNKEGELSLTSLLFEIEKKRAIEQNKALIDEIKKSADLNDQKIASIEANKILLKQALASGQLDITSQKAINDLFESDAYKAVDRIKATIASSKVISGISIGDWTTKDKATKEKTQTEKSLNDILTKKAWHEARIAEAELVSKEATIEAYENYQNYLRDVEKTA